MANARFGAATPSLALRAGFGGVGDKALFDVYLFKIMKISTQILSTYLPHKLQFAGGGDIWTLYSVGAEGDIVLKNGLHTQVVNSSVVGVEYLPILRPLCTFYQHSIFDGEMFCPKDRVTDQLSAINGRNNVDDYFLMCDNAEILRATKIYNYMASLHFDLFGLIDQNLAVNYFSIS